VRIYCTVTDEDREATAYVQDLVLRSHNDQTINVMFLDEWEDSINISGATVYFTIKNKPTDLDNVAIINKTFTSSTFPDALSGEAAIILTKTETASLLGNYIYSIVIKLSDGTVKTASEGNITFQREIRKTF